MPRDCTAPQARHSLYNTMYSPASGGGIQYTPLSKFLQQLILIFIQLLSLSEMPAKQKNKQAAKAITAKRSGGTKRNNIQLIVAPTQRAVRSTVTSSPVRRQEMVIPVKKTTDKAQEFVLHPKEIPWFGGIAPSYQRWGMQNLKVWYEPRVSTSTNGTISMAFLSDFKDDTPTSFQSLTSIRGAVRGAPWDKFTLACPKYRAYDYTKDLSPLSNEEKNDRAIGRIVVIADMDDDFSASNVVGRIFLEYTPVFIDPIDPTLQGVKMIEAGSST